MDGNEIMYATQEEDLEGALPASTNDTRAPGSLSLHPLPLSLEVSPTPRAYGHVKILSNRLLNCHEHACLSFCSSYALWFTLLPALRPPSRLPYAFALHIPTLELLRCSLVCSHIFQVFLSIPLIAGTTLPTRLLPSNLLWKYQCALTVVAAT